MSVRNKLIILLLFVFAGSYVVYYLLTPTPAEKPTTGVTTTSGLVTWGEYVENALSFAYPPGYEVGKLKETTYIYTEGHTNEPPHVKIWYIGPRYEEDWLDTKINRRYIVPGGTGYEVEEVVDGRDSDTFYVFESINGGAYAVKRYQGRDWKHYKKLVQSVAFIK